MSGSLPLVLTDAIRFVEHNATQVPSGHICGPDSNCDGNCVNAAMDADLLERLKRELRLERLKRELRDAMRNPE